MENLQIEIELNEFEKRAIELADNDDKWHFHIATEGCRLAGGRTGLTFFLEDQMSGQVYRAAGTESDRSVGSRLAARLHGADVFEKEVIEPVVDEFTLQMDALLEGVRQLSSDLTPWHHHVLFPECTFNPSPETWTVQIEGPDQVYSAGSNAEPKAALSVIEKLFYAQKSIS